MPRALTLKMKSIKKVLPCLHSVILYKMKINLSRGISTVFSSMLPLYRSRSVPPTPLGHNAPALVEIAVCVITR